MTRDLDHRPIRVPEQDAITVADAVVDRVRRDRLVQVLRHTTVGIGAAEGIGVSMGAEDLGAGLLEPGISSDMIGVPVRVRHPGDAGEVYGHECGGGVSTRDEASVHDGRDSPGRINIFASGKSLSTQTAPSGSNSTMASSVRKVIFPTLRRIMEK